MARVPIKSLFLALAIAFWLPVAARSAEPVSAKPELSIRDQIKVARAKEIQGPIYRASHMKMASTSLGPEPIAEQARRNAARSTICRDNKKELAFTAAAPRVTGSPVSAR